MAAEPPPDPDAKSWWDFYKSRGGDNSLFSKVTNYGPSKEQIQFSYIYNVSGVDMVSPPGTIYTVTNELSDGRKQLITTEYGPGWVSVSGRPAP